MKNKNIVLMLCSVAVALIMMSTVTARPMVEDPATRDIITDSVTIPYKDLSTNGQTVLNFDEEIIAFLNSDEFETAFSQIDLSVFAALNIPQEAIDELLANDNVNAFINSVDLEGLIESNPTTDMYDMFPLFTIVMLIYSIIWGYLQGDEIFETAEEYVDYVLDLFDIDMDENSFSYFILTVVAASVLGLYDWGFGTPLEILQAFLDWITGNNSSNTVVQKSKDIC